MGDGGGAPPGNFDPAPGGTPSEAWGSGALRVVQLGLHADRLRRDADTLLDAWPTLTEVAAGVARAGVDVTVVQVAHERATRERDGVRFRFVREHDVVACAASLAPHVLHVHGLHFPRALLALRASGTPVLVQDHGSLPPVGWRRAAWRWAYRDVAGVAFTAREQATPFVRAHALRRDVRVFEVLEGSTHFTTGDREAARATTGMRGDPCVLWTGRLDANKDPLTMLSAFERACAELPGARLHCCHGAAPLLEQVRHRVSRSPVLRERVTLLGTRPHAEMERRLRAADLFVQTSHREGSGYSLLEALACGTPPVVTDIPAARRIVGDAGSLTPVGDVDALARALVTWARGDREAQRRAARERFERALTFDAIGHELRAAYECVARDAVTR